MKLPNDFEFYLVVVWTKDALTRYYQMRFLSFEFFDVEFDYIMFLKFDFPKELSDSDLNNLKKSLELIYLDYPSAFIILTPRKDAPLYTQSSDEFIHSFSCNYIHFRSFLTEWGKTVYHTKNFLFQVLNQILDSPSIFDQILVRQIPIEDEQLILTSAFDVVIPHRGDNAFLDSVLFFMHQQDGCNVSIGIDQELDKELLGLKKKYPSFKFYAFKPNPVGPYVIRNALIDKGTSNIIFFQDSDDVPCADRFPKLSGFMAETGCQLCGSHEVRIDYFDKTVRAHRFPKDVIAALAKEPGHPMLHPASAIRRGAFYLSGKLSEERIFGNDTKFLLHSFFVLSSICNLDEFLYIRRRHSDSLTTSPDTRIGSPGRLKLQLSWNRDFENVKHGTLKLEDSNLNYNEPTFGFNSIQIT